MGRWPAGSSTASQVPLSTMALISSFMAARQAGSESASANDVGSSDAARRSSSGSSSLGAAVLMQSSTMRYRRGAPSSSRSMLDGMYAGGDVNTVSTFLGPSTSATGVLGSSVIWALGSEAAGGTGEPGWPPLESTFTIYSTVNVSGTTVSLPVSAQFHP
ncbi:hypothetical protein SEVIR_3G338460v4 [Setaria viridis]